MPKQLIGETRVPVQVKPGQPKRQDFEYVRNGTAAVFMSFSPPHNWRQVSVRERRTRQDWAHEIQALIDQDFPDAEKIVLVMDNLNTHNIASLYATFPAEEALRLGIETGDPPHAEAWQLAEHGRTGTERTVPPSTERQDFDIHKTDKTRYNMGDRTQRRRHDCQLAIHNTRVC